MKGKPRNHLLESMTVRTCREVAELLGCSHQAVAEAERRAFRKLRASARVRELWQSLTH